MSVPPKISWFSLQKTIFILMANISKESRFGDAKWLQKSSQDKFLGGFFAMLFSNMILASIFCWFWEAQTLKNHEKTLFFQRFLLIWIFAMGARFCRKWTSQTFCFGRPQITKNDKKSMTKMHSKNQWSFKTIYFSILEGCLSVLKWGLGLFLA